MPNTHRVGYAREGKAPKLIGAGGRKFCLAVSEWHRAKYGHRHYIIEEIDDPDAGPPASWTK